MKTNTWTIAGYISAGIYAAMTFTWYWIKFPDINEFFSNMAISFLIAAAAWIYNEIIDAKNEFIEIKNDLYDSDKFAGSTK